MKVTWTAPDIHTWLSAIRWYLAVIAVGNLLWEFAHMPLYTLWRTGTVGEIVFAAAHCTGGDVLIATASLVLALIAVGSPAWPSERFLPVAVAAMALGLGYTAFSEWLNIGVRRAWAYSDLMPVLPWFGTGLSPLAQWLVVPALAFRSVWPRSGAVTGSSEHILHHGDAR
jgi:hypothetical protein